MAKVIITIPNGSGSPIEIPHNTLDGLQGSGPDYFHLTQAEYTDKITKDFVPLLGTAVNKPVTGNVEFRNFSFGNTPYNIYRGTSYGSIGINWINSGLRLGSIGGTRNNISIDESTFSLNAKDGEGFSTILEHGTSNLTLTATNPDYSGFFGNRLFPYFGNNFQYVQHGNLNELLEDYIPLGGTQVGNSITGDLECSSANYGTKLYQTDGVEYSNEISFLQDEGFTFKRKDLINNEESSLSIGNISTKIESSRADYLGLIGNTYFNKQGDPNAYVQLEDVNNALATQTFQQVVTNGNTSDKRVFFTDGTIDLSSIDITTSPSILTTTPQVLIARTISPTNLVSEHGFGDNSLFNPSVVNLAYNSFDTLTQIEGSTAINHYSSYQSRPTYKNTGEIQLLQGYTSYPRIEAGNVRYNYAFRARCIQTGGNIERNYGLWVDALPAGSIETYAVITNGSTPSLFGGVVNVGGLNAPANALTLTGSSASFFINGLGTPTLINATIRNQTLGTLPTGSLTRITASSTVLSAFSDLDVQVTDRVRLTTSQTIAGVKTFSSSPIVPTPTTSTQVANKAYVDAIMKVGATLVTMDGVTTVFNIPHGLGALPSSFSISFEDASNLNFVQSTRTLTSTNIVITCDTPPLPGSQTVYWQVYK